MGWIRSAVEILSEEMCIRDRDYSERPFNLHGRICLGCSIAWGFFTLLTFEILQPFAQWVIDLFDVETGHAFIILCGILYCVDFIVSTLAALQLGEKLEGLQTAKMCIRDSTGRDRRGDPGPRSA